MTQRMAKLVPWYHEVKDRCKINTIAGTRCKNSAGYVAVNGRNGSSEELPACKPHSDILAIDGWKVRRLRAKRVSF